MRRRSVDEETRALSVNPVFQRMIAEGRVGKRKGISADELDQRRPVAPIDQEYAEAFGAALDRLESDQETDVTEEQGRILKLVLTAADYARRRVPLAQLAEDSGLDQATLRAAAVALEVANLRARTPVART